MSNFKVVKDLCRFNLSTTENKKKTNEINIQNVFSLVQEFEKKICTFNVFWHMKPSSGVETFEIMCKLKIHKLGNISLIFSPESFSI